MTSRMIGWAIFCALALCGGVAPAWGQKSVKVNNSTNALIDPSAANFASANSLLTSSTGVSSLAGTSNQIAVSGSTGAVTLSIPSGRGLVERGFANGTAVLAGTPDYAGQLLTSTDGYIGVGTGTGAGNVLPFFIVQSGRIYSPQILRAESDLELVNGRINQTNNPSGHNLLRSTDDNVLHIQNMNAAFHSVIAFLRSTDPSPGVAAIGVGNSSASSEYADTLVIATNTVSGTGGTMFNIKINQESDGGLSHRRYMADAAGKSQTLYGFDDANSVGPIGVFVAATGDVGIGTSTLTSGAKLTVNGAVSSSQQRWHASRRGGGDQTIPAATWTDVAFTNEEADPFSIFASNTATPTMPGVVHMDVTIFFNNVGSGNQVWGRITKNGTSMIELRYTGSGSSDSHSMSFSYFATTDGDDTFKVQAYNEAGGDIGGETHFQGWVQ